ncbi:MAG TPA: MoaD/ThiS family protein [Symbiobacteriaceae bacterium]|nr:MoaD/ThiS family protein [Symbiobacteriaceae bacterium]
MAKVWLPALMRELVGGREMVAAPGATLGEVIGNLEQAWPGVKARLCRPDGSLHRQFAVLVDDAEARRGLRTPVGPDSEIRFIPPFAGG